MNILVISDFHVPDRNIGIPNEFVEILQPGKLDKILCLGNLGSDEALNYLKTLCKDVVCIRGDNDYGLAGEYPETSVITINGVKIGMIHGHQVLPWGDVERLASYARDMNVDVLLSGHTHKPVVFSYGNRLFLNPGSATGAYSPLSAYSIPSFMLLSPKKTQIEIFLYQLNNNGEVQISRHNHSLI